MLCTEAPGLDQLLAADDPIEEFITADTNPQKHITAGRFQLLVMIFEGMLMRFLMKIGTAGKIPAEFCAVGPTGLYLHTDAVQQKVEFSVKSRILKHQFLLRRLYKFREELQNVILSPDLPERAWSHVEQVQILISPVIFPV